MADKKNEDTGARDALIARLRALRNRLPANFVFDRDDANAWDETAYLRASPKNAERLNKSIAQLNAGLGVNRDLIEE